MKCFCGKLRLLILQVEWDSVVTEAYGNEKGRLGGVKLQNVKTGEVRDLQVLSLSPFHPFARLMFVCTWNRSAVLSLRSILYR